MANSRKSTSPNSNAGSADKLTLTAAFERALGAILARVCAFTERPPLSIAVAYSGGLDSSVLLHLTARHAAAHGIKLHAFHVHHGLSPNADQWIAHCEAEAARCRVPFDAARVELADSERRGVEEAARVARYAALGELCRRHGVGLLLTAHQQDDQAETVLLQLMRGAGLPGLSGMAAFQDGHDLLGAGVALGRPLLHIARVELEQEARRLGLAHVEDESNEDTRYRRNALRRQIMPQIEQNFPNFTPLIGRSARHIQSAQLLLQELAEMDLERCRADVRGDTLALAGFDGLSDQRIDNLLRHWLYRQGVQLPSTARLEQIRRQMLHAADDLHPFFDFGPVRLHRIGGRLELHPNLGTPPGAELKLQWRGEPEIAVPEWCGRLFFEAAAGAGGLDAEQVRSGRLTLRARSGQERLKIAANRPSKSLKSLFQEHAIAPWQRAWLPLLYLDDELAFVAGLGMDARRLTGNGTVALRWEFDPI
jgi:tRNA(Ile)-lysidine synthase